MFQVGKKGKAIFWYDSAALWQMTAMACGWFFRGRAILTFLVTQGNTVAVMYAGEPISKHDWTYFRMLSISSMVMQGMQVMTMSNKAWDEIFIN